MSNFRKSFNFRNGVQVDDDNFVVNPNGLVGIGTSIPTEFLDVRGTAKVVGLATISNIYTSEIKVSGVGTFGTITDGTVNISSGIITSSSGIVSYFGDGTGLVNIPTSQWVDVNPGAGFSSIYAAGTVGIATTMPGYFLQVGGNPDNADGVGINSTGNITATGILTASKFYGYGIGVTGINANYVVTGTIDNARLPNNIDKPTGIVTASSFVGTLTGAATSATQFTGVPDITVGIITANKIIADIVEVPNTGITTISKLLHVGTGGTAFSVLEGGRAGLGTAIPSSELQIVKDHAVAAEVISETGIARVSVGQSVGFGNSTGVLRFGSGLGNFDVINNALGDVRTYIHAGGAGIGTGNFKWVYGQTNAERMTLTYDGNLGVNQVSPEHRLHVVGTSTITGSAWVGNLNVAGSVSAGSFNLPNVITSNLNTTGVSTIAQLKVTTSADFTDVDTNIGFNTISTGGAAGSEYGLTVNNRARVNFIAVTEGIAANSGFVTAFNVNATRVDSSNIRTSGVGTFVGGITSDDGVSDFVKISYQTGPDRIVFTVTGVGTTELLLF